MFKIKNKERDRVQGSVAAFEPHPRGCCWERRLCQIFFDKIFFYKIFFLLGRDIGRQAPSPYRDIASCSEPYGLQTYPHPKNCDQFYKCENGTLTLETCENGLLFDGKGGVHNHCNYYWAVDCEGRVHDREFFFKSAESANY